MYLQFFHIMLCDTQRNGCVTTHACSSRVMCLHIERVRVRDSLCAAANVPTTLNAQTRRQHATGLDVSANLYIF
jgi:hypothetical protein